MTPLSQSWRRPRFYAQRWTARAAELYVDRIVGHGERPPFRSLTVENLIRTWRGFPEELRNDSLLAVAVLAMAMLAATYLPARRASRLNPVDALRCD